MIRVSFNDACFFSITFDLSFNKKPYHLRSRLKVLNDLLHFQDCTVSLMSCSFLERHTCAVTLDFKRCCIFTSEDSDESVQPPFKLRNSKCCLGSSFKLVSHWDASNLRLFRD